MEHTLKTDPLVFDATVRGVKNWEIRKNDRDFQLGDELHLRETVFSGEQMADGKPLEYTGRTTTRKVTFALYGPEYGLSEGWCILSTTDACYNPRFTGHE